MTSSGVLAYRPVEPDDLPGVIVPAKDTDAPLFSSDGDHVDRLDRDRLASRLAGVLTHRRTETPLCMALFGPAGSGKSLLLRRIADRAAGSGPASPTGTSPSQRALPVVPVRVDLAPGRDPATMLAHALLHGLVREHGAFAEDALHAGGDPHEAARHASERSMALRRSLDGERRILDEFGARRAKLVETVLFDTGGTRVDGYARTNRVRIESRLRAFGLPVADPLLTYKDFVRQVSEAPGATSRVGFLLRALWGFKGQGSLVILAVLLFALAWAAGMGADDRGRLSTWLAGLGDRFAFVTDWERAHLDWLQPISQAAWALGALALLAVAVRAVRFVVPIFRGVRLLKADLEERRRDIDGLIAQQTRRIDGLVAEADSAARNAEQAERRLGGGRARGLSDHGAALASDLFGSARPPAAAAEAFCAALSRAITADAGTGVRERPARILVAVDGFDDLAEPDAALALQTLHRLLARPGFVTVLALERLRASEALGAADPALAAVRLDRIVQMSYDLGAEAPDPTRFADLLLDPRTAEGGGTRTDGDLPSIDRDLQPFEVAVVEGLAPFAGATPRAVKRFVNAYRLARTDPRVAGAPPPVLGCLAWSLAIDGTPASADLTSFEADAARGKVQLDKGSDLGRAFSAVHEAIGGEFTARDACLGVQVARSYSRGR